MKNETGVQEVGNPSGILDTRGLTTKFVNSP